MNCSVSWIAITLIPIFWRKYSPVVHESGREIGLWNVRAVLGNSWGEEKLKIVETVYNRLMTESERLRILAGDFNSPLRTIERLSGWQAQRPDNGSKQI